MKRKELSNVTNIKIDVEGSKTLNEAFAELIRQKKWYVNGLRGPGQAKSDKYRFLKGERVPEHRLRDYLSAAGYVQVQDEKWKKFSF